MREHYDFSTMQGRKNPFAKQLQEQVTMNLDKETVAYFKALEAETGIPYSSLIHLYLRDCALHHRKLKLEWTAA